MYYPSLRVHCDFCDKDITRHTKVIDADGLDTDMCVNCFIAGEENHKHSKDNPYHVINRLTFPLYEENWTAEEELLILEGLEKYGLGNWSDIADHIGTDKTGEDAHNHYEKIYMSNRDKMPPSEILSKRDGRNNIVLKNTGNKQAKQPEESDSKRKKSNAGKKSQPKVSAPQTIEQSTGTIVEEGDLNPYTTDIVGYMPFRGDFDYEYDNEAELFLAEMEFNGESLDLVFKYSISFLYGQQECMDRY